MLDTLGKTQKQLLQTLQAHKKGLSINDLAKVLVITRTAVRQHITALEAQGFIAKAHTLSSGGRPCQFYVLSQKGIVLFPKQYSLFSELLLRAIMAEKGADGLSQWLQQLGEQVAQTFKHKTMDCSVSGRLIKTVNIMNTLAYDAKICLNEQTQQVEGIEAVNCVYHDLAVEYPQVCEFDIALLSGLSGSQVQQQQCIQKGDNVCRFCIKGDQS